MNAKELTTPNQLSNRDYIERIIVLENQVRQLESRLASKTELAERWEGELFNARKHLSESQKECERYKGDYESAQRLLISNGEIYLANETRLTAEVERLKKANEGWHQRIGLTKATEEAFGTLTSQLSESQKECERFKTYNGNQAQTILKYQSERLTLLDEFCRFAEKEGYLDSDWYAEEPKLIDRFQGASAGR